MFFNKSEHSSSLANEAIKSTQRAAREAIDSVAEAAHDIRHQTLPMLDRAAGQVSAIAQHGVDGVRGASKQLRHTALRVSDQTVGYIKDEPVKSVLLAAATGAALMALISLLISSRNHR